MKLEEIAKLSGVSRSTVSRVVNNDPNVGEATREKVLEIIQQAIRQPIHRVGVIAAETLIDLIEDPAPTLGRRQGASRTFWRA